MVTYYTLLLQIYDEISLYEDNLNIYDNADIQYTSTLYADNKRHIMFRGTHSSYSPEY